MRAEKESEQEGKERMILRDAMILKDTAPRSERIMMDVMRDVMILRDTAARNETYLPRIMYA
jgi:hypothetical protein